MDDVNLDKLFSTALDEFENNQECSEFTRPPIQPNLLRGELDILLHVIDVNKLSGTCFQTLVGLDHFADDESITNDLVRFCGTTSDGFSITVFVRDYLPPVRLSVPDFFNADHCNALFDAVNNEIRLKYATVCHPIYNKNFVCAPTIQSITISHIRGKKGVFSKYASIIVPTLRDFDLLKELLEERAEVTIEGVGRLELKVHDMDLVSSFMEDLHFNSSTLVEIQQGCYKILQCADVYTQLQVVADWRHMVCRSLDLERPSVVSPIVILSFDIECLGGENGHFPCASTNPVIMIACVVVMHGHYTGTGQLIKHNTVFIVGPCTNTPDANVCSVENETQLLLMWSQYVRRVDPDVLTGYNIFNFDLPYLLKRSEILNTGNICQFISRSTRETTEVCASLKYDFFTGRVQAATCVSISGRLVFDLYPVIKNEYKMKRYTLANVSSVILNYTKDSIDISKIHHWFNESNESRSKLASYCLKDATLPIELIEKLGLINLYSSKSAKSNCSLQEFINRLALG